MYYIILYYNIIRYIALDKIILYCSTLHYITFNHIALHCIALHNIILYHIVSHYTTLYYTIIISYCIILYYVLLDYIILYCIVFHYNISNHIILNHIVLLVTTLYTICFPFLVLPASYFLSWLPGWMKSREQRWSIFDCRSPVLDGSALLGLWATDSNGAGEIMQPNCIETGDCPLSGLRRRFIGYPEICGSQSGTVPQNWIVHYQKWPRPCVGA